MSQAARRLQHTLPECALTPKSTQSLSEIQISVGLLYLSGSPDHPSPPLVGRWVFPSFPLQTAKVVVTLSFCSCARTPTGRAPQSGLLVPDGICNVAGFCRLPFIRVPSVYTPLATCRHACSPTALPTERITKVWDPCHFVWWEMGIENFQNTVNKLRWKMQIRKLPDSASGQPACCGHSVPVGANILYKLCDVTILAQRGYVTCPEPRGW